MRYNIKESEEMIFVSSTASCPSHDERVIDEHVPISFRSYPGLLGVKYLMLGNFQSTLLELLLDPISYAIRGITLSSFDKVHVPCEPEIKFESIGLPVIDIGRNIPSSLIDGKVAKISCNISIGVRSDFFEVDFSEIKKSNKKIYCGRTQFFLKDEELTGIRFISLVPNEISILKKHIAGIY